MRTSSIKHKRIGNLKWCFVCQQYKDIGEFYTSRCSYDGHTNVCKACQGSYQKPYQREYYLRNREKLLPKHRESAKLSNLKKKLACGQ